MDVNCVNMDFVGWLWLVVLCSWLLKAFEADGYWETILSIWAILAILAILAISMARSKNTRKGKAPSSSMERAVKKWKANTSQTVKKGKGKRKDSSSESEEASESEDEEIEAMFVESSKSEREKWVQSIE